MASKAAAKKKPNWIGKATAKMKAKGTVGKFGKATPKKIAAAKTKGGKAEKEAVFAQNMKKIAMGHKAKSSKRPRNKGRS